MLSTRKSLYHLVAESLSITNPESPQSLNAETKMKAKAYSVKAVSPKPQSPNPQTPNSKGWHWL